MTTIEKGIPIPPRFKEGPTAILGQMGIGDSIVIPIIALSKYRTTASRMRVKLTTRKIPDQSANIRIWRLT